VIPEGGALREVCCIKSYVEIALELRQSLFPCAIAGNACKCASDLRMSACA
jgi:hypothetical protein